MPDELAPTVDEVMQEHFECWARGKSFIHIPAVRQAMWWLLMQPDPNTGLLLIQPRDDGFPDYDIAYRRAIVDLGLNMHN